MFKYRVVRRLPQIMRHFTHEATNLWIQSIDLYKPGMKLRIQLPNNHRTINVKIAQAFTPFTNSVTLLIDTLAASHHLPDQVVLKLADRRFTDRLPNAPWNIERELDLQMNLLTHLEKFGEFPKLRPQGPLVDDPPWIQELHHWNFSHVAHRVEREAYERLTEAQSLCLIPRFFGSTRIIMASPSVHPSLDHLDGLLLEYIPGRSMASIKPGIDISEQEAEHVSQKVLELGRRLRQYGVTHSDVHRGNVILRSPRNDPVLIDWGRAGFVVADAPLEEKWANGGLRDDFNGDIRSMLKGKDSLWHRFQTPFSDEEQMEVAANIGERGWGIINRGIARLPEAELQRFYYEDRSVAENDGLRWKVRMGVRTRMWDDPIPKP